MFRRSTFLVLGWACLAFHGGFWRIMRNLIIILRLFFRQVCWTLFWRFPYVFHWVGNLFFGASLWLHWIFTFNTLFLVFDLLLNFLPLETSFRSLLLLLNCKSSGFYNSRWPFYWFECLVYLRLYFLFYFNSLNYLTVFLS